MTELGDRIRRSREEKGWSQQQLADEISKLLNETVSPTTISAIERGKTTQPKAATIDDIAAALDLNGEELKVLAGIRKPGAVAKSLDDKRALRLQQLTSILARLPEADQDAIYRMALTLLESRSKETKS